MAASTVGSSSLVGTQVGSRPNSSHLNKIFVGGLPSQVGETEFSEYFSQYGEVVDAQVMIDHQTGNSRGFGFISFADQSSVETVVGPGRSNTRHEIMGKTVEVKRAEPKGSTGDRRGRDSYSAGSGQRSQYGGASQGVSGMVASGNPPNAGVGASAGVVPGAAAPGAAGGAYAGYNYPASIMEQYGAYYNNPQWQQYYAAMGYNMSAYPQGFNPYTYYAAYMNNAAVAGGTGGAAAGGEGADGGSAGSNPVPDGAGLSAGHGGEGQNRNGYGGTAGNGTGGPAGGAAAAGPPGSGSGSSGPGARRVSRRDDRYHPYR
jgi:heterogeneous nuclear ribonucleoprotein A1/A3